MQKLQEALAKYKRGKVDIALKMIESVLSDNPGQLDALLLAGQIHHEQGNPEKAVFYLESARKRAPGHVGLSANLAAAYLALGQAKSAEPLARSAVLAQPNHFGARLNLGLALFVQRRYASAADELSRALNLKPDSPVARKHMAHALQRSHQMHFKTRAMLQDVLNQSPNDPETRAMLADSYVQNAETDTGVHLFEELLDQGHDIPPNDGQRYYSSYLLALHYRQQTKPEELFKASREWDARYGEQYCPQPVAHRGKKLRIGWISPRFSAGPVACFLLPVLAAFDRSLSEHYLYATRLQEGTVRDEFRHLSDVWRELDGQTTDEMARLIASDELDILVDLAGHSPGGVLPVLCRRPAAVQVSWLDSFCTTGVRQMDAFIGDPYLCPPGDERYFSETLVRLKTGRLCYRPQGVVAEHARHPHANGIVFASFNRLSKLGDDVLHAWSKILNAVPGSSLVLRNTMFDDAGVCDAFRQRCESFGLSADRLSLSGYCHYAEIMAAYADVDIVLDPFPFSGCTTSCDALWMGVPIITRTGSTLVSRQSGAILDALGLGEFIAQSTQEYITAAIKLAGDEKRRCELRSGLRKKMQLVFDPQVFTDHLFEQFQQLVRTFHQGGPQNDRPDI